VLRDRNHPSVFIWSIGNEVMEQWERNGSGEAIATELAGIVRSLDDTRPVTAACNDPMPHNPVIASGALDLIGFNYRDTLWTRLPQMFPGGKYIGTETTSALATRGAMICHRMLYDAGRYAGISFSRTATLTSRARRMTTVRRRGGQHIATAGG